MHTIPMVRRANGTFQPQAFTFSEHSWFESAQAREDETGAFSSSFDAPALPITSAPPRSNRVAIILGIFLTLVSAFAVSLIIQMASMQSLGKARTPHFAVTTSESLRVDSPELKADSSNPSTTTVAPIVKRGAKKSHTIKAAPTTTEDFAEEIPTVDAHDLLNEGLSDPS